MLSLALLPKRPAPASESQLARIGNRTSLISNLFPIHISESIDNCSRQPLTCFQFDTVINPEIPVDNRSLRYEIFHRAKAILEESIGKYFFSGQNLFALKGLPVCEMTPHPVIYVDGVKVKGITYSLSVKQTESFELREEANGDCEVLNKQGNQTTNVLNNILKQAARDLNFYEIGNNSKFFDTKKKQVIGDSTHNTIEIYKGFNFGIYSFTQQLYLMVDYSALVVRKQSALSYLQQFNLNDREAQIVGKTVMTEYNNYQTYVVDRIETSKSPLSTFLCKKTNLQISFAAYYKRQYGKEIQDLNQPLLVSIRNSKDTITNQPKTEDVFLIPELCKMTGLTNEQRSNFNQMKEVSQHTKLSPFDRYQESQFRSQLLARSVKQSGLQINANEFSVSAIRLNQPVLTFGDSKSLVQKQSTPLEIKQPIVEKNMVLDTWLLMYNKRDSKLADQFSGLLQAAAKTFNITINQPYLYSADNDDPKEWINLLREDLENYQTPQIVVSLFSNTQHTRSLYTSLKKYLYQEVGIGHQHITPKAFKKNGMQVASKVALQIATKIGKKLWLTQIPSALKGKSTMLIGIVASTKKIFEKQQMKSVIGVVASINSDFTSYYSEVDIRNDTDTQFLNLSLIIKKSITAFMKHNSILPDNVIIYRQGLGEGPIAYQQRQEIEAIQKGFEEYNQKYEPKFAIFYVNKKISQKFYEKNKGSQGPSLTNPTPGSLIPNEVFGQQFSFLLCAQSCNSGVCTPTKYTCLSNTTDFSEDVFWQLTYFQCFNYYNWTGSIRVPAPMMYAGKLAKFTSEVLNGKATDKMTKSLYYL